jgi:hypothetical protein
VASLLQVFHHLTLTNTLSPAHFYASVHSLNLPITPPPHTHTHTQEAFFHLALTNTRRVSRLSSCPEPLAVWALELLRDAAEAALKFVQVCYGSAGV